MKNIKKISIAMLVGLGILLSFNSFLQSETKNYYSGDVISYNNFVFFGSTNMGYFEMFVLDNNEIIRTAKITAPIELWSDGSFYDFTFNKEDDDLFVYLVNGRYIYKYDFSNYYSPELIDKKKDNSWDWFNGITRYKDQVATIGTKGVKVWNNDLMVVNSYDLENNYPKNISFSDNFAFNIDDHNEEYLEDIKEWDLEITNLETREVTEKIYLTTEENKNRKIYKDDSQFYIVDDRALKKFNYDGNLLDSFTHTSGYGYDVDGAIDSDYVYFSYGLGVIKVNKETMEAVDSVYTTNLGFENSWAMGMGVAEDSEGEKVVVFNNSGILVLDDNLEMIDYYEAVDEEEEPIEEMWLSIDKNRASAGSQVSLRGGGFGINEELLIEFVKDDYEIESSTKGNFSDVITVPSVFPGKYDIKVTGQSSGLSYSIGFEIE